MPPSLLATSHQSLVTSHQSLVTSHQSPASKNPLLLERISLFQYEIVLLIQMTREAEKRRRIIRIDIDVFPSL